MSFILTKNAGVPVKYLIEGYIEQDTDRAQLRTDYTLGSKIKAIDTGKTYVLTEEGWKYLEENSFDPSILDDYYTKEETDELIATLNSFVYVDTLPTENIKTNVIYLVPAEDPGDDDIKDEYLNLDGTSAGWERIGSTKIDLTQYYTKTETDAKFVEKEAGKGLSTNDYTTTEKQKLAGLNASDFATAAQGTKADNAETKNIEQDNRLDAIEEELVVKKTVSGNIVSVHDAAAYPVEGLEFAIEPVQEGSGDPSPENVRPISGWTGVNGERTGKNLWNYSSVEGYIDVNGSLTGVGSQRWNASEFVQVKANKTYTFYVNTTVGADAKHAFYDINKTFISAISSGTQTFTVPANAVYMRFSYRAETTNIQLELGSTATTYEPYQGTSIPITFPSEAGTVYGGKVDVVRGKLLAYPEYDSYNGETLTGKWISSMDAYVEGTTPTIGAQVVDLSGVGTEYDITPQEVQMLLGDNNVWCDTGDMTLEYYSDNTISQLLADLDNRVDNLEEKEVIVDVTTLPTGSAIEDVIYRLATTSGNTTTYTYYAGDATNQTTEEIATIDDIDERYWVGTRAEYNNLQTPLADGTLVFITDETLPYLSTSGGTLTGDVTTSNTTFINTSLVTKAYVDNAIAAITDYETEVFPNG